MLAAAGRELRMRNVFLIALAWLALTGVSKVQVEPKLAVSNEPLSAEQIAIYRVVLADYRKGTHEALNLADRTEPLQRSEGSSDLGCISGITRTDPRPPSLVHRITAPSELGPKLVLVDPDRQQGEINKNDPQNLVKRAIDDHERVTDKQLGDSIKKAFEVGVFTLSEIAFDKGHQHAIVAYSFVCGGLCGNGNTLLLKKVGRKWKVTKRCGGWVS